MGFSIEKKMDENDVERMLADGRVGCAVQNILVELARAEQLHPVWPADTLRQVAIMTGEAGETLQAGLHLAEGRGTLEDIKREAIQTGAMAVRLLMHLEE